MDKPNPTHRELQKMCKSFSALIHKINDVVCTIDADFIVGVELHILFENVSFALGNRHGQEAFRLLPPIRAFGSATQKFSVLKFAICEKSFV